MWHPSSTLDDGRSHQKREYDGMEEILMPPPNNQQILDLLLSDPKGVVIACNLQQSIKQGLVTKNFASTLVDWWFDYYRYTISGTTGGINKLLDALDVVISPTNLPANFRPGTHRPDFLLQGRYPTRKHKINDAQHVMTFTTFRRHVAHEDDYKKLTNGCDIPSANSFTNPSDRGIARAMDLLQKMGRWDCRITADGTIGRSGRILWFTSAPSGSTTTRTADEIRDMLGMIDRKPGNLLIEVTLPATCLAKQNPRRPTAMDAGSHQRFRVRADGKTKQGRKAWGHAVDLGKFARGEPNIDGACERVCQPIPATAVNQLSFRCLGKVTTTRGNDANDNDDEFAKRLLSTCPKTDVKALKTFMMDLV